MIFKCLGSNYFEIVVWSYRPELVINHVKLPEIVCESPIGAGAGNFLGCKVYFAHYSLKFAWKTIMRQLSPYKIYAYISYFVMHV